MHGEPIPELTLRRLPRYYDTLKRLDESGCETVSTTALAEVFQDVHPTQIRKDLAMTGIQGKPKVGYGVKAALAAIEDFLCWNNRSDAFLVGAGSLGAALLGYPHLQKTGINIVAAFDASPRKVGVDLHGIPVLPMAKFKNLANRMRVPIGILTVPGHVAQECAELMIQVGMRGIWNFTSVNLSVPSGIVVENVDLFASLAVLGGKIRDQRARAES